MDWRNLWPKFVPSLPAARTQLRRHIGFISKQTWKKANATTKWSNHGHTISESLFNSTKRSPTSPGSLFWKPLISFLHPCVWDHLMLHFRHSKITTGLFFQVTHGDKTFCLVISFQHFCIVNNILATFVPICCFNVSWLSGFVTAKIWKMGFALIEILLPSNILITQDRSLIFPQPWCV